MNRLKFLFLLFISIKLNAQESLPIFSVSQLTETKARIYWKNNFSNCSQITIQKSYDSLKYFKTIFSSLSPELPENAFVDNDYLQELRVYYRILFVIDDANYAFTKSKTPTKINASSNLYELFETDKPFNLNRLIKINKPLFPTLDNNKIANNEKQKKDFVTTKVEPNKIQLLDSIFTSPVPIKKMFVIYKRQVDSLYKVLDELFFLKFKDSIIAKTKDTLYAYENDIIVWKQFIPEPSWQFSEYVFTAPKGHLVIQVPLYKKHKYKIIFYDDTNEEALRINHIKADYIILEKSNFIKAGWYSFELYEDDKLKEKNKFLLVADF